MIFQVDKEQYKGAEVAALLNAEIENMKAGHDKEALDEMSDLNLVGFLVYTVIQKTDDDFMQDLISRYCRELYENEIVSFLRN